MPTTSRMTITNRQTKPNFTTFIDLRYLSFKYYQYHCMFSYDSDKLSTSLSWNKYETDRSFILDASMCMSQEFLTSCRTE